MTPLQMQINFQANAKEEGQVIMLLSVLPILVPEELKEKGIKKLFTDTLLNLGWLEEDISYWTDYFNLENLENVSAA